MEIITGYTGKPHVTSEQDRDVNIGIFGGEDYVLKTGMQLAAEVSSNNEIKIRDGVLMHQGCSASIKKNTYDSLTIVNGSQGMKRIDLIVARYQKNQDNGTESIKLEVIQGTPVESNPVAPEHIEGDIQAGDHAADMLMYQVVIDGLNITEVKKLFEVIGTNADLTDRIAEIINKLSSGIPKIKSGFATLTYKSSSYLQASVNVGTEWNGKAAVVSLVAASQTPYTQVTELILSEISGGKLTIQARGSFVSGHVLRVSYVIS